MQQNKFFLQSHSCIFAEGLRIMAKLIRDTFTTRGLTEHFKTTKCFNKLFEKVNIISSANGKAKAEMTVGPEHANPMGTFHGGFSAALLDTLSTVCVVSKDDVANSSINMQLSFLNSGQIGDELEINAEVIKSGRKLAFVDVNIINKNTGAVLVKGVMTHVKLAKL